MMGCRHPPDSQHPGARGRYSLWLAAALGSLALAASPAARAFVRCRVSASGVAFGIYDPSSSSPLASTGSVTTTCTLFGRRSVTVGLTSSLSTGSSGSYVNRTMRSGASALLYNLYLDWNDTQIAGDGTAGTFTGGAMLSLTGSNRVGRWTEPLYGLMPARQDVPPGIYADTIVVTVNY
ncbi:MAG TPA: spore coat U domain-containing protein [Steroidobacteraceae bacterium]|nr:spore coat U domain-containing protein [Steroidobacteraceae bacterium]